MSTMENIQNILGEGVFIIAEIGSNHNGDFELAKEMVKAAAQSGANAVKFQTYKADKLISKDVPAFERAKEVGFKTQFERFKQLEFSPGQLKELSQLAGTCDVLFMSTPFDNESVETLDQFIRVYKIASADIINIKLLRHVASKNKPVILSTGQATVNEIDRAIRLFKKELVALMHCVSAYPTPDQEANLHSITFLKSRYNFPIGYSDHTIGILGCVTAVGLGAKVIEKHFTFDKSLGYGDHLLSADPDDLAKMVTQIRRVEKMLGTIGKKCMPSEAGSQKQLRRYLYLSRDVSSNTVLSEDMIDTLMSNKSTTGISANRIDDVIGKKLAVSMRKADIITDADLVKKQQKD